MRPLRTTKRKNPMNEATYRAITKTLKTRPALTKAVTITNKLLTNAIYCAYPCLLIWLVWNASPLHTGSTWNIAALWICARAFLVPFISFVALTVLRKAINAPRPYETFNTPPVIPKQTRGLSFPSRHVFSIFVIATTFIAVCPATWIGIVILCMGVVLACIRVIAGVHFPRDVIVGGMLGIICGVIGFWIV